MKKIYIKKSKIAGRGIFAGEDIKKGEFVTWLKGKLVHKVYRTNSDLRIGQLWVSVGRHWWIDPVFPIRFINHCCEPNVGFKTFRRVYAMRDIKKDEEITIDYSTVEYVDFWTIKCSCGARHCRKVIGSVQLLPEKTYKSYLPYIPRFFQKEYLQYKNRKRTTQR